MPHGERLPPTMSWPKVPTEVFDTVTVVSGAA